MNRLTRAEFDASQSSHDFRYVDLTQEGAHARQVEFHQREIAEGPTRKPPMPPEMVEIHKAELRLHLGALGVEQIGEHHGG